VILVVIVFLSLPKSRLRALTLTIVGWLLKAASLLCLVYIVSPIDLIPDAIPVLGISDDAFALIVGALSGIGGLTSASAGRREERELNVSEYRVHEFRER